MKKAKRIFCLIIVIILVLLYAATLVFALIGEPWAYDLFKITLALTFFLPILLYVYFWIAKLLGDSSDETDEH